MNVIDIKNLHKSFAGKPVLKDISISIPRGDVIGYLGPNGAGKSTTIKILTGIISDFEGEVLVNNLDVQHNPIEVKQMIGYIPEQAALYEVLTPIEYLYFVGKLHQLSNDVIRNRSYELLRLLQLQDKANQRMNSFSKGMKQKVLLISGLMHNPDIIFLDEPLSGLDANAVILVKALMIQLKKAGKTIFYSSHIMDVVEKISNRIVIIDQGRIIADGTFAELQQRANKGSLENIFTSLTGAADEHISTAEEFISVLNN